MQTTADLIILVASGDEAAWGRLAERHIGTLRAVAIAICGDSDLAEDAVQEAFLRLRAGAAGFRVRGDDPEGDGRRWLKRIAANGAIDQLRRRRRRREQELADRPAPPPGPDADGERRAAVALALASLSPPARAAVELRYGEGLDGEALATALGVGLVAARVRLHRALAQLRRRLAAHGVAIAPVLLATLLPASSDGREAVGEDAFAVPPSPLSTGALVMLVAAPILAVAIACALLSQPVPAPAPPTAVAPGAVATGGAAEPAAGAPAADPVARPPLIVTGVAWGSKPAWSADGRFIVYARARESGQARGEIRAIEVATGIERSLGRVAYPAIPPKDRHGIGGDITDELLDPAAARAAKVLHPCAASADLAVVWLDQQGRGLWSWRPADGRLVRQDAPRAPDDGFRLSQVALSGPEGRIAFIDRWSRVGLGEAADDAVAWLAVPELADHYLDAVGWWRGHLVDVLADGRTRILWPASPTIPAPVFPSGPERRADDYAAPLRGRDLTSGDQLTESVTGNPDKTLAGLPSTATALGLRDLAGQVRWTRALDWSAVQARLSAAVMAAEIPTGEPPERQQRYKSVWAEAEVIAYRHPRAVLQLSVWGWYGMSGKRADALMGYDCDTGRLIALGDDVYSSGSGGLIIDSGALPACVVDPAATAVAFRQEDRITVLRGAGGR